MIKRYFYLIIFLFLLDCSLNPNSKFWTNENPGKPGSKQYEAAVQRTMTKFINGKKGVGGS